MTEVAQHQHTQGFEEEAPDHAKGVGFTQQVDVALAQHNGGDLKRRNQVDDAVRGAKAGVRLAKPVEQHAVFGQAIQHAIGADHGSVDGAR